MLGLATDDQQRVAVAQSLGALGALPSSIDASEQIVRLANALWVQQGIALKPSFTATMRDRFGAPVRGADFARNPKQAVDAIKAWASAQTNGHIPKVFEQLDPSTVVVLANALYAKLTWLFEANPNATTARPFTRADATIVQAPTMTLSVPHGAAETVNGIDMVSIPYRGDYEMVVAATPDPSALAALDRPLTGGFTLTVRMPRFESRSTFDLLTELRPILPNTFGSAPDLTGLGLSGVVVDQAVHKAWTKTDEKGTEGAAVTSIDIAASAPPPKTIVLDKTFTYIVRHRPTGLILFMGRVDDPNAPAPPG